MAHVFLQPQLRDLTSGATEAEVAGRTLGEIIAALDAKFPGIAARVTDGQKLTPGLAVAIDGTVTSRGLLAQVGPKSEIHFLPAIGGG